METSNEPITARTRRNKTPSDSDLKIDNTVQLIPNLKFIWINGGNEKKQPILLISKIGVKANISESS